MVLKSHTVSEVRANISQSLAMLGPGVTLDTITEMLFIGMGLLAGIFNELHEISVVILLIHSCRNTTVSTHQLLQLYCSVHQLCCLIVSFPSFSFPCSRGSHRYLSCYLSTTWLQVYSIEINGNKMFGIPKHNPLMFRLKLMTVSCFIPLL